MPGSIHISTCPITRPANGAHVPYRFIGVDNAIAGAGANAIGVTPYAAEDGVDNTIEVLGLISVETGAAVTEGALIESDATGRAIDRTAGAFVARALDGPAAAGEFVRCILIPN